MKTCDLIPGVFLAPENTLSCPSKRRDCGVISISQITIGLGAISTLLGAEPSPTIEAHESVMRGVGHIDDPV